MTACFPNYIPTDLSGSGIDQLGQFEDILAEAEKKGIISSPPANKTETYDVVGQKIRLQTIATRLWLLGYLQKKIPPGAIHKKTDEIKAAVACFQKDANLKQDVWVGDKTWFALDQLVSFESELNLEQWFTTNGKIKPEVRNAMHRAIQLRLWSLGLYKNSPNKNFKLLTPNALKNLKDVFTIFLIKNENFTVDFTTDTLCVLFDQDMLTKAIARRSSKTRNSFLLKLNPQKKEAQQKLAQKFIVNCAKIELWLLGYEVNIDGKNDFELSPGSDLYKALCLYYQQFENRSKTKAQLLAKRITPQLFKGMAAASTIDYHQEVDDKSEEIAKEMQSTEEINNAWAYVRNKGVRLWDGLKRLWRWIKKIGKKVISFIKENVFKAFFRYASKAFKIVGKGISKLVKSIHVYLKGQLYATDIYFQFSKDMDSGNYLSSRLNVENSRLGIHKLSMQSKAFNLACRIIGYLFSLFKKLAIGFVGWARLLYSLVKGYGKLKLLYADFKAISD